MAANVDKNQREIVKALREIHGVEVEVDHDDILVGYLGKNFWFELKSGRSVNKSGEVMEARLQPKQKVLRDTWSGHYSIVSGLNQILSEMGICFTGNKNE